MAHPDKYIVNLSETERERLKDISRNGQAPAKKILHARILLLADQTHVEGGWTDQRISEALGLHPYSIARIRKRFVTQGEAPALNRKVRTTPPNPVKVDGEVEAQLVAICCSPAPEGRAGWTLNLLVDALKARSIVTEISRETVRQTPKKNELRPWKKQRYCIPEKDSARFVAQMEVVLDLYTREHPPEEPLICMDEAAIELHKDVYPPQPMQPGCDLKQDYHYDREGVRALFMFFDPIRGWRRVTSREHRTRIDWAEEVKQLLDEDYPHARKVKLLCDNLNTYHIASSSKQYDADEAHRLARRLELFYTPRNGSWLNITEIELSVLRQQCLERRIGTDLTLNQELAAWQHQRNQEQAQVQWRFTTKDARVKLRRLYPNPAN
ncbi:MAG: IS630 family transposase [Aphanothece sp. CMT-3BRIN-NPC111]|nr:IS630 family transposase [Aphanothece sp. CMT-3BRIN-NPC111]